MAIFYARTKFLTITNKNAVHAAAYRRGTVMRDEMSGKTYDYSRKHEVYTSGIAFPDAPYEWVDAIRSLQDQDLASASMWNFVQASLPRCDAQFAAETTIALPRELTAEQWMNFAKELAGDLSREGFFVDWALHAVGAEGTEGSNPHLHVMTTLRPLVRGGFGRKRVPVLDEHGQLQYYQSGNRKKVVDKEWAGRYPEWKRRRKDLEILLNKHLAMAGIDVRVDCRSNAEKGNGLGRSIHIGSGFEDWSERSDVVKVRTADAEDYAQAKRERILQDPAEIFTIVTEQRAVLTKRNVYNELIRLGFSTEESRKLGALAFKSGVVLPLEKPAPGQHALDAVYSTLDMVAAEKAMLSDARSLSGARGHGATPRHVTAALNRYAFLSGEQQTAVRHVTEAGDLKSVVGLAGSGKSTLLKAANEAWAASGLKVRGVALAGKAAEELKASSGIESGTLASLLHGLSSSRVQLERGEVIVLDEAGMVGSRDMATLIGEIRKAGAKLVLTGDPKQLPAISAGAAYRAILERVDPGCEINTIRRQKHAAHRQASQSFARFDVKAGLDVYREDGAIHAAGSIEQAIFANARQFTRDYLAGRDVLAISYRNKDVRSLNETILRMLQAAGKRGSGIELVTSNGRGEEHKEQFAKGDRIVFLKNEKSMGVTNGTTAVLERASKTKCIALDGNRRIVFDPREYNHFTHGYAVTIHKSQGASVDHVHVLASPLMDRNLTYVAMTRHKQSVQLHYDESTFKTGLAQTLGRANEKTSTLDYIDKDDVAGFGERRGVDSWSLYEQVKDFVYRKVKGLWKRIKVRETMPEIGKVRVANLAHQLTPERRVSEPFASAPEIDVDNSSSVLAERSQTNKTSAPTMAAAKIRAKTKKGTETKAVVPEF
ncbi:MAG: Ti-type conjugative transfer relaxase TraA [Hyphomonadaceae bacterium]